MAEKIGRIISVRAYEYSGYWHTVIRVQEPNTTADDFSEDQVWRQNEKIPLAEGPLDQAWLILVYAIKQLEFEGAGGKSGGMEFPALF